MLRICSNKWLQSWHRWLHAQDMLTLYYDSQNMEKQLCKDAVVEITSVSLMQIVASFPSDEECRSQFRSDGFTCGDIDGVDYHCLAESLLKHFC